MLGGKQAGKPFRGEVSSSDASGGVAFTLYDQDGVSFALGSNQRLVITSYSVVAAAAGNQAITSGTDIAGRRLRKGTFTTNSGMAGGDVELECRRGVVPVLFAPAGQVDAQIEGRIFF